MVTGAEGDIGSHPMETLIEPGARVRALVRYNCRNDWGLLGYLSPQINDNLEVMLGDLTHPYCAARALDGCSLVFHPAALIAIPYSYVAREGCNPEAREVWRLECDNRRVQEVSKWQPQISLKEGL